MHLKIHNKKCLQFLSKWIYLFKEWSEDYFVSFAIWEIIFYILLASSIAIKFVFYNFIFFKFNNVTRLLKHTHLLQTSVAFDALSGYHFHIQKIIKFSNEKLNDIIQNRAHKENWFAVVHFYIKNIYFMKNFFAPECYLLWHIHKYWSFRKKLLDRSIYVW